jgi:hypothetical protein
LRSARVFLAQPDQSLFPDTYRPVGAGREISRRSLTFALIATASPVLELRPPT